MPVISSFSIYIFFLFSFSYLIFEPFWLNKKNQKSIGDTIIPLPNSFKFKNNFRYFILQLSYHNVGSDNGAYLLQNRGILPLCSINWRTAIQWTRDDPTIVMDNCGKARNGCTDQDPLSGMLCTMQCARFCFKNFILRFIFMSIQIVLSLFNL